MSDHPAPSPERLSRKVSDLAACSRAQAEQYIEGGWVKVDGEVVESPQFMVDAQCVELDPDARLEASEPATMLLHKPADLAFSDSVSLITEANRIEGDERRGIRTLQRHFSHLQPLMPLDDDASGLVVASQDPRTARRLKEDGAKLEQEYLVEIDGQAGPYTLSRLARGLSYEGRTLPTCKVSWQNEIRLRFAIKDVRPGQLRDMCAQVGLRVVAIRRLRIGRIGLNKMPVGQWRYMPVSERF
ncbi:rRNA pseudouridine synthase [Lysobacter ciconiae]|uniref:Dual-specificity RNA pseudouridine synthase RluF n=1 Tax=Novilysobacter ciconiae TaxID=2781022 RepID=A0A7S6UE22_9GAMM|nr:rRNA pseudouridine synthase [Lysobacter ciconiae]QOW18577.1 rRNA pseudouridine synthase [Lysobacter ciconiae]